VRRRIVTLMHDGALFNICAQPTYTNKKLTHTPRALLSRTVFTGRMSTASLSRERRL